MMMMVFQRREKVMSVLVWTLMTLMFSGAADDHRLFGSGGFERNSFFKPSMRPQDSSGFPKFMSRAEAEKMYVIRLKETQQSLQAMAPSGGPASAPSDKPKGPATGRIFHVTDYGADPTGASDSTQALMSAINDVFNLTTEYQLLPNVSDFGGAEIHLQGGNYKLSAPLRLPPGGNILANAFIGVHCYNKATALGGVGIQLRLPGNTQTRILSCYMDYTGIVAEDPVQLTITNSFFLGDATITLKSTECKVVKGVNIVDNTFSGTGNGTSIVQLDGSFDTVEQTVVDRNNACGMTLKSTVARGTVQGNGTTWTMDFSQVLLFPDHIQHVQYSFSTPVLFPRHALRNCSNNTVVVESDVAVPATVAVTVDQSATLIRGQGICSST